MYSFLGFKLQVDFTVDFMRRFMFCFLSYLYVILDKKMIYILEVKLIMFIFLQEDLTMFPHCPCRVNKGNTSFFHSLLSLLLYFLGTLGTMFCLSVGRVNCDTDKIVVALRRGLILYLGTHNNEGGIFKHRINHYYEQGFPLSFTSLTITNYLTCSTLIKQNTLSKLKH